jgi:ElaB/YqjD/DUF883 family membrane-anchored ribosome-binding protein
MAQMTWRTTEELLERLRRQARSQGRSLNDWVTTVLSAASDPDHAGDEAQQLRERLARAGILEEDRVATSVTRPDVARVSKARARAGRGTPLSQLVSSSRR